MVTKRPKRILFTWIGGTDLKTMHINQDERPGSIEQVLTSRKFDRVVLLSSYPSNRETPFLTHVKDKYPCDFHLNHVNLKNPTDHGRIFVHCSQAIDAELKSAEGETSLTFLLSAGTPAMHAIWILLAKNFFEAELIQASRESGVETVRIPFKIQADYQKPLLLDKSDAEVMRLMQSKPLVMPKDAGEIIYASENMSKMINLAVQLAARNLPVLIEGESGTGKELMAKYIHSNSERAEEPFVAINCGAIPKELAESELFGHEKGSFTGAVSSYVGKIEQSSKGTLFLDEIGELPLDIQVKLLRVLQEEKVTPVGGKSERRVDLRLIAATNRTLQKEVASGNFREDLFFRIAAGYLYLPPIRERGDDIKLLINHFLAEINAEEAKHHQLKHKNGPKYQIKKLTDKALDFLLRLPWTGNVRELSFTLTRAALLTSSSSVIDLDDVKEAYLPMHTKTSFDVLERPLRNGFSLDALLDEISRHYIERALKQGDNKIVKAAKLLGISNYQTLNNRMKKIYDTD